jgi:vacuolar-type H+-ATPase subunit F/Vma7
MPYDVRVLCRPEIGAGFALAGLRPTDVAAAEDGSERLRDLLDKPNVGVVLMEEALYDRLPDDLRRQRNRRPLPIVVPFPGPAWGERAEAPDAYIVDLLRQVIGYRVRLK